MGPGVSPRRPRGARPYDLGSAARDLTALIVARTLRQPWRARRPAPSTAAPEGLSGWSP